MPRWRRPFSYMYHGRRQGLLRSTLVSTKQGFTKKCVPMWRRTGEFATHSERCNIPKMSAAPQTRNLIHATVETCMTAFVRDRHDLKSVANLHECRWITIQYVPLIVIMRLVTKWWREFFICLRDRYEARIIAFCTGTRSDHW